jgi:hypothetical protein
MAQLEALQKSLICRSFSAATSIQHYIASMQRHGSNTSLCKWFDSVNHHLRRLLYLCDNITSASKISAFFHGNMRNKSHDDPKGYSDFVFITPLVLPHGKSQRSNAAPSHTQDVLMKDNNKRTFEEEDNGVTRPNPFVSNYGACSVSLNWIRDVTCSSNIIRNSDDDQSLPSLPAPIDEIEAKYTSRKVHCHTCKDYIVDDRSNYQSFICRGTWEMTVSHLGCLQGATKKLIGML